MIIEFDKEELVTIISMLEVCIFSLERKKKHMLKNDIIVLNKLKNIKSKIDFKEEDFNGNSKQF